MSKMNNIVIITPIYKIVGRNDLQRDTECVHDLIKKWNKEHNIHVFHIYVHGIKEILKFFNCNRLRYYYNGYDYECDNISVTMIEKQNIKKIDKTKIYNNRFKRIIQSKLNNKKFNPDFIIVHIPSISYYFIKKLDYKCSKVAVLHYTDVKFLKKKEQKFITFLEKNYTKVFCRSEAIYNEFKKYNLKNLSNQIIYSGVPNDSLFNNVVSKKFTKNKKKFLYVGKLIKRKNLDILINSLSKIDIKKWDLNVIGAGPMLKEYKRLVKHLKLENNVHFLGTFSKKKVFEYMDSADIFCMPSIKETLGLVYLEAMSHGCITIGTKNEGIDGIIKNNYNGYLVNPNEKELSSLILKILDESDEKLKYISDNAIKTVSIYNEDDMSEKYLKIVSEVFKNENKKN